MAEFGPFALASLTPVVASIVPGWDPFVNFIKFGLNSLADLTNSAGLAIILFTIIVKLLVTPLTVRSLKSSRAMQSLQPKIKALQKRHGDDRQKISAETMRLYQEHGVNPLASCFPMLVQIPIFIALYQAIDGLSKAGEGFFATPFLWLPSLAQPDPLHILPFAAAFFQLIQTRMSMPTGKMKPTDPQQVMMLQMMQFLPLTVIIFGWSFAAGPVIYWATQSIFGAIQQYFITGWGALREWLPFLPEVVRWTPPTDEEIDESKVIVTGSDAARRPAASGGLFGLLTRQLQKAEEQRRLAAEAGGASGAAKDGSRVVVTSGGDRRVKANGRPGAQAPGGDGPDEDGAPRRSSRIVYTNATQAPVRSNGKANGTGAEGPPAGGDGTATTGDNGPLVPRRNRNRR